MTLTFTGAAARLADTDLPELGHLIGVGEDELHAFIDTETRGHGFDGQGRPLMLFEPHVFYRHLKDEKLATAVAQGLAYPTWGEKPYPSDSYPRLIAACAIDETAALMSASWGLGQILGKNHAEIGYATVQDMVAAFCASEKAQLKGVVDYLIANHLDDDLRAHNWAKLAAGYNGRAYAKNGYDVKLAANFKRWQAIKDTPWSAAPVPAAVAPSTPSPAAVGSTPALPGSSPGGKPKTSTGENTMSKIFNIQNWNIATILALVGGLVAGAPAVIAQFGFYPGLAILGVSALGALGQAFMPAGTFAAAVKAVDTLEPIVAGVLPAQKEILDAGRAALDKAAAAAATAPAP